MTQDDDLDSLVRQAYDVIERVQLGLYDPDYDDDEARVQQAIAREAERERQRSLGKQVKRTRRGLLAKTQWLGPADIRTLADALLIPVNDVRDPKSPTTGGYAWETAERLAKAGVLSAADYFELIAEALGWEGARK